MVTRKKLRFDTSWQGEVNRVYQMWYGNPVELRRDIERLYEELRAALLKLPEKTPEDQELDFLVLDWWQLLGEVAEQTISYWDAHAVRSRLQDLKEEFLPEIEKEIRQLEARARAQPVVAASTAKPEPAVQAAVPKAKKKKSKDLSDDEFFALSFAKTTSFGKAKADRRPSEVRPQQTPWVPPTPQQEWADQQVQMGKDCDEACYRYRNNQLNSASDHAVNQPSVARHLGAGAYFQVRPSDNTNDQMRIYISVGDPPNNQYWARGLSHDAPRRAGAFYVYRRTGNSSFVHVAGRQLERHARALL
ncbi:hypothetical protein [Pararhodobacter sp. SW119]|uniref:hypothetical protein n=1 Tax=Pararhodobacter sp. SW119 TaxID=2780075 RepID=UPI001AE0A739|nr:hypothetical protein [Pararhodobacter sp. SW119]